VSDVEHLGTAREVHVETPRKQLPIWSVVVDGVPYIRSFHGERGAWYRRALREGSVVIDGVPYGVQPEHDAALNERISQAFRDKYGARSPRPTKAMVSPEIVATTLRLSAAEPSAAAGR
jgi:hypothetical protein